MDTSVILTTSLDLETTQISKCGQHVTHTMAQKSSHQPLSGEAQG
jgi:hypothetical protein